jgi:hypothetical protein
MASSVKEKTQASVVKQALASIVQRATSCP